MSVTIKELQMALLDELVDIDAICKKHDIHYVLSAGTALGAVRHKGFIPWDDDLDIMMMRSDYERFLAVAPEEFRSRKLTLQKEFSAEWPMTYSKVRRDGTTYLENYVPKVRSAHQGIFIDIFAIDNLYDNPLLGRLQWVAFRILAAKCLSKRGYTTDSLLKKVVMVLSQPFPKAPLIKFCKAENCGTSKMLQTYLGAATNRKETTFPRTIMAECIEVPFEGKQVPLMKDWDEYLRSSYGDYMQLPSEEDRVARLHARVVDLNKSYTEYVKS